ncbi:MAG: hypothetical protein HOQ24_02390 [Mycobacteriaceae bacterium]|nr:hypothetical protein [Mycobacteriaceae bacterium]
MLGVWLSAFGYFLVLIVMSPLVFAAWLLARYCPRPGAVRNSARLILLSAAYLATFEIPALIGTPRLRRRRQYQQLAARINTHFVESGFRFARMRIHATTPLPPSSAERPVIVLARHAGAFNSYLVWHQITRDLRHYPETVAKRIRLFTPGFLRLMFGAGVVFIECTAEGRAAGARHLRRMAAQARADDALLLFPEGTNYTRGKRTAAIAALRAAGRHQHAARACEMRNVLPPHPGGARLLVTSRPDADVLIFAHTGLEDLLHVGPRADRTTDGAVYTAWWHVPADQVPHEPDAFAEWLSDRWCAADQWITQVRIGAGGRPARTRDTTGEEPPCLTRSGPTPTRRWRSYSAAAGT